MLYIVHVNSVLCFILPTCFSILSHVYNCSFPISVANGLTFSKQACSSGSASSGSRSLWCWPLPYRALLDERPLETHQGGARLQGRAMEVSPYFSLLLCVTTALHVAGECRLSTQRHLVGLKMIISYRFLSTMVYYRECHRYWRRGGYFTLFFQRQRH